VAFGPDGQLAVTTARDGSVLAWDLAADMSVPLDGHRDAVWTVAISPDGRRALTGDWAGAVLLWDLTRRTSKPTPLNGHTAAVTSAAFTADGQQALTGDDRGEIRRWDLAAAGGPPTTLTTPTTIAVLEGHTWSVEAMVVSPDGTQVVTTSSDTTARLWDLATNTTVAVLDGHDTRVIAAGWRSGSGGQDPATLATIDSTGVLKAWPGAAAG
jgi:WD40 repeat protein